MDISLQGEGLYFSFEELKDMSAFFIKDGHIDVVGTIYRVKDRKLQVLTEEDIKELEQ